MAVNVRVESRSFQGNRVSRDDSMNLIRRFKRACNEAGILSALKEYEFYEKPCEKRNRKRRQAELQRRYAEEAAKSNALQNKKNRMHEVE